MALKEFVVIFCVREKWDVNVILVATKVVDAAIVQNAIQPGTKLCIRLPRWGALPKLNQAALQYVFGQFTLTQYSIQKAHAPSAVASNQRFKRRTVAPCNSPKKGGIVGLDRIVDGYLHIAEPNSSAPRY